MDDDTELREYEAPDMGNGDFLPIEYGADPFSNESRSVNRASFHMDERVCFADLKMQRVDHGEYMTTVTFEIVPMWWQRLLRPFNAVWRRVVRLASSVKRRHVGRAKVNLYPEGNFSVEKTE